MLTENVFFLQKKVLPGTYLEPHRAARVIQPIIVGLPYAESGTICYQHSLLPGYVTPTSNTPQQARRVRRNPRVLTQNHPPFFFLHYYS